MTEIRITGKSLSRLLFSAAGAENTVTGTAIAGTAISIFLPEDGGLPVISEFYKKLFGNILLSMNSEAPENLASGDQPMRGTARVRGESGFSLGIKNYITERGELLSIRTDITAMRGKAPVFFRRLPLVWLLPEQRLIPLREAARRLRVGISRGDRKKYFYLREDSLTVTQNNFYIPEGRVRASTFPELFVKEKSYAIPKV